jgi:hypothetical protein
MPPQKHETGSQRELGIILEIREYELMWSRLRK